MGKVYELIGRADSALQNIIGFYGPRFCIEIMSVMIGMAFVWYISPLTVLVLLSGLGIFGLMVFMVMPKIGRALEQAHRASNKANEHYYETLGNAIEVKKANMVDQEVRKVIRWFQNVAYKADLKEQYLWVSNNTYRRMVYICTQAAVLFLGVYLIKHQFITIGQFTALNAYVLMTFDPFIRLSDMWLYFQSSAIKVKDAHDMFSKKREEDLARGDERPIIEGELSFDQVVFQYNKKDGNVLRNVSFEVPVGASVALVGKSGSGKSTLVDLIGGFYFPQKGLVLIDGVNTKNIDLKHLRQHIAYVSQEVTLFNDTVAKNISYGVGRKVSQKEIESAAKQAHCHEFISEFKQGYKQIVGERGVKLSVGQKQRIAIARAILSDPVILILDEPTSALDSESEQFITQSLSELMKGRTTFIIAHRLSTVRNADQILVMKEGCIIESGSHTQLMDIIDGHYRYLYTMHVGLS